jgi:hypothetical protein
MVWIYEGGEMIEAMLTAAGGLQVEDAFSTTLYTGNGATQTINNGIDLAGEGGLVWIKNRYAVANHSLTDTRRGARDILISDRTDPELQNRDEAVNQFFESGFEVTGTTNQSNAGGSTYVSWTFRQAPKFFDIVQYTGDGVAGRQIAHDLGAEPGMIVVKRLDGADNWYVWHRQGNNGIDGNARAALNDSGQFTSPDDGTVWGDGSSYIPPSKSEFTTRGVNNAPGGSYIAYLFAHDPSDSGIIQCGSFVNMSPGQTVNLGWQPQYIMVKRTDGADNWVVIDTARGFSENDDRYLFPNSSQGESGGVGASSLTPTATGFKFDTTYSGIYIYMAIKAPE